MLAGSDVRPGTDAFDIMISGHPTLDGRAKGHQSGRHQRRPRECRGRPIVGVARGAAETGKVLDDGEDARFAQALRECDDVGRGFGRDTAKGSKAIRIVLARLDRSSIDVGDGCEIGVDARRLHRPSHAEALGGDRSRREILAHRLRPRQRRYQIGEPFDTATFLVGHHEHRFMIGCFALQRRNSGGEVGRCRRAKEKNAAIAITRGGSHRGDLQAVDRHRNGLVRELLDAPGRDDLLGAGEVRRYGRRGRGRRRSSRCRR